MAQPKLNWASAEVKDGKLVVALEGELSTGWKQSFDRTVVLLRGGDWGKVELKTATVRVSGLEPDTEEKLRHFLESVVEQANADHRPTEDEPDESEDEDSEQGDDGGPDAEMTERFRSFGD
jgi:hypothetical protein